MPYLPFLAQEVLEVDVEFHQSHPLHLHPALGLQEEEEEEEDHQHQSKQPPLQQQDHAPHPINQGEPTTRVHWDRERESQHFLLKCQVYWGMNPTTSQLTEGFQQCMTFLSYIGGPNTDNWVKEQANWTIDQIIFKGLQ